MTNTDQQLTTGATFVLHDSKPWTDKAGNKHQHVTARRYRVTAVKDNGVDADYLETVTETGRPSFAGEPLTVSLATFVIPLYITKGRLVLD